jgi:hypothetical protein
MFPLFSRLLLFPLFAEDLQHESLSGSISKYRSQDKCRPDQSNYPTENPFDEKRKDY